MARAQAAGEKDAEKRINYTMFNGGSDPELVRKHLDSGVLQKLIQAHEAKILSNTTKVFNPWTRALPQSLMFTPVFLVLLVLSVCHQLMIARFQELGFFDPCYENVLLGACAMTVGCDFRNPSSPR